MNHPWVILTATVAIIVLSAFFVAVEFALLAARRHRLEEDAATSRAARAALRSSQELTVLLAGAQLGITACTFALGAVTKPAVHHWITPLAQDLGAPLWVADAIGFALALVGVTFLHLVIGEMMPKSWAIAHPEASAKMLALPMRGFMALTRPLLVAMNGAANRLLLMVGVEPAERRGTSQNADDLRHLVEHSTEAGALDVAYAVQLAGALDLRRLTVRDLIAGHAPPAAVTRDATAEQVRRAAHISGHLRILIRPSHADEPTGVVHVRDTLLLEDDAPVLEVTQPIFELAPDLPLHEALTRMREASNHLAVVRAADGHTLGVVTMADVLARILPAAQSAKPGAMGVTEPSGAHRASGQRA
ncbi:CNNM domain-containing protein [Bogoriella caseilytica]|uniref:CBS domain containing-hemolysin-like protein n=1 Tax=Bogoriella caseilytica TaxID=56055 RepID=A0A3N2BBM6_9MICO|nr:hemolysin family protein [Bogoriella caseilytica]ROR72582.1 CBS domain containing-hemolysin-like protein [Bogoriella caseilytica]